MVDRDANDGFLKVADPHTLSGADAVARLSATENGLTNDEAASRLAKLGPNLVPSQRSESLILRFARQFHHVLIYVLIGSAAITALLAHWVDTAVILAVVIANAVIGYLQEGKAEKAMDAIQSMLTPHAAVYRDGQRQTLEASEIVPGDIVSVEAGDRIPADIRLLQANGLQVQEAILTGESVPVEKSTDAVDAAAPLGDRRGMVFSGTLVTAGQAKGIVTGTGTRTEIGQISSLLGDVKSMTTPLLTQINGFAKWITLMILIVAGLLLSFGVFVQDQPFDEAFMVVVGLSVAAIPEGLPAVLTITMAIGVQAMAKRNAIVRRLPAIETLGSVSVICTDKTGTLTRNEMVVAAAFCAGKRYLISGDGYGPEGEITDAESGGPATLPDPFLQAALYCNDAALISDEDTIKVSGDPMEGALLALVSKSGNTPPAADRTAVIPFDSQHCYMATQNSVDGAALVFVKGAPEAVLERCQDALGNDAEEALPRNAINDEIDRLTGQGMRVLALAYQTAPPDDLTPEKIAGSLTFLGLVGLIDPPRPEAVEAVAVCQDAGIVVKMITGDHAGTASAIAREIGLENPERVLTGKELDQLSEGALRAAVLDTHVFARTSPENKLRLVNALQAQDLVVAMTGDGVNDAPALKRADVGIAMGMKGSETAKEAAPMVLADDNFASIAAAVREGRTVYDNIKKVISWLLPTSGGEAFTITVAMLLGMTLPITPIQILWVNLVTAVTLGMALAFEPTEEGTMLRPPRPRDEPILNGELVWHVVLVSLLFLAAVFGIFAFAKHQNYSDALAQTMAVNTLVVLEIFHLFFIRNIYGTSLTWQAVKGTRVVWLCVISVTLAQFLFTFAAPLQAVFRTEAVPLTDGLLIIGLGVVFFALLESEKQLRLAIRPLRQRRRHRAKTPRADQAIT